MVTEGSQDGRTGTVGQAQNRPAAVEDIEPIQICKPDEECHCTDITGRARQKLL
jgi:hypothetical protein